MLRVDHARWGQTAEDLRRLATSAPHQRTRERFLALYEVTRASCATRVATRTRRHPQTVMEWLHLYNTRVLRRWPTGAPVAAPPLPRCRGRPRRGCPRRPAHRRGAAPSRADPAPRWTLRRLVGWVREAFGRTDISAGLGRDPRGHSASWLAHLDAAWARGARERSGRSEGSGAAPIARRFWSGRRRERRRWRVPIHGRAFDRSGGNCPSVASFASFAARVHVHSARRSTAARTGRAQRRVRSFRARRLVLPPPLGSISGGAMRTPLSVAPPVVYIS